MKSGRKNLFFVISGAIFLMQSPAMANCGLIAQQKMMKQLRIECRSYGGIRPGFELQCADDGNFPPLDDGTILAAIHPCVKPRCEFEGNGLGMQCEQDDDVPATSIDPVPPTDPRNPCMSTNGDFPSLCIMRADRFVKSDPFLKHRSCAVTNLEIVQVDVDHGVVQRRGKALKPGMLATLTDAMNAFPRSGGETLHPPFSTVDRLTNWWWSLDTKYNPVSERILLRSQHKTNGSTVVDFQSSISEAQTLIQLLEQNCDPLEP
jgi:hypothetical protein